MLATFAINGMFDFEQCAMSHLMDREIRHGFRLCKAVLDSA